MSNATTNPAPCPPGKYSISGRSPMSALERLLQSSKCGTTRTTVATQETDNKDPHLPTSYRDNTCTTPPNNTPTNPTSAAKVDHRATWTTMPLEPWRMPPTPSLISPRMPWPFVMMEILQSPPWDREGALVVQINTNEGALIGRYLAHAVNNNVTIVPFDLTLFESYDHTFVKCPEHLRFLFLYIFLKKNTDKEGSEPLHCSNSTIDKGVPTHHSRCIRRFERYWHSCPSM
eukprot:CCRYP_017582-RA/>CCRYP_017582-RA protein AED:0.51 eAED:0.40 QI:0/0/0/0.5/1/1/2/0/230